MEGKERFRGKKRQARWQGTVGCRLKELHSSKKVDWRQSNREKKERTKGQVTPNVPQRPKNPQPGNGLASPPNSRVNAPYTYQFTWSGRQNFSFLKWWPTPIPSVICKAYHFHNKCGSSSTTTSLPQGLKTTFMQLRPSRSQTKIGGLIPGFSVLTYNHHHHNGTNHSHHDHHLKRDIVKE